MAARHTAGPAAPQNGTTSAGPRSVPPKTEPPPLGAETTPPPARMTAPVVTRPAQPPGRAGDRVTPMTGAGAAPPARIPLGACDMTRQTWGAGRSGNPVRLPMPAPRMSGGTNPHASANATIRKAGSLRHSRPRASRTGCRLTLWREPKRRQAS